MVINPLSEATLIEIGRMIWFLGKVDLTVDDPIGQNIQDAHETLKFVFERMQNLMSERAAIPPCD